MAASMSVFGDDAIGWRLPSLIAGLVALLATYAIVRRLGGRTWLGVLAVTIYSLDVLSFIHGRIGTLDMVSTALLLVGAWLGLTRRWLLAGAVLATATLVKFPAIYGLLAAFGWLAWTAWESRPADRTATLVALRVAARAAATLTGAFLVVGLAGLWLLDLRFTSFANPFEHLSRILSYGFALQPHYTANSITSEPWEWLAGLGQFDYLKTAVNVLVNGQITESRPVVEFRAALNPMLIGAVPVAILFGLSLAVRRRDRISAWALIWIAATYFPYWFLALVAHRITYLYYVLPTVPAFAVLVAVMLTQARFTRGVTIGYVALSFGAFLAYFPFRQPP